MELIQALLLISILLIVLIFLMTNFKWIIRELRDICQDEGGYIKLIQLIFVLLVFASFFVLLVYNLFYRESTSKLDIFLTVIVGLIGTIIGAFFSERTMESIKMDRDFKRKVMIEKKQKIGEKIEFLNKLLKELD
jgi:L-cystine uptake protein TcyP (sodium:dicarboxylate symporter family)|tara:strand:+ start:134 stop:538 length:405 start_codon:yes stop_codon:yes gene_type:complete